MIALYNHIFHATLIQTRPNDEVERLRRRSVFCGFGMGWEGKCFCGGVQVEGVGKCLLHPPIVDTKDVLLFSAWSSKGPRSFMIVIRLCSRMCSRLHMGNKDCLFSFSILFSKQAICSDETERCYLLSLSRTYTFLFSFR